MQSYEKRLYELSPELSLLTILSLPLLTTKEYQTAKQLLDEVDFSQLESLAIHHRTFSCVVANLDELGIEDTYIFNTIRGKATRSNQTTNQLLKLHNTLMERKHSKGYQCHLFKGIKIAFPYYQNIYKRHLKDFDYFVPLEHFERVAEDLESLGFTSNLKSLTEQQIRHIFKDQKDIEFRNKAGLSVEVHHRLYQIRTPITDAYERQLLTKGAQNKEVETLYYCLHATRTLFHRLKWLIDLKLIFEKHYLNEDAFSQLFDCATNYKCLTALTVAWAVANKIYNIPLPALLSRQLDRSLTSRLLLKWCLKHINSPGHTVSLTSSFEKYFTSILFVHGLRAKKDAVLYMLTPNIYESKLMPNLPKGMTFLRYCFKPLVYVYLRFTQK